MTQLNGRLRLAILERDGYRCVYCGAAAEAQLEIDHVQSKKLGGQDHPGNLVTACRACNNAKRTTPLAADLASVLERPMPDWWHGRGAGKAGRFPAARTHRRTRPSIEAWCWSREGRLGWPGRIGPFQLGLYAEIDYTPVLGDADPYPTDPFDWYCQELRRRVPHLWGDSVPILWSVETYAEHGLTTVEIADWDRMRGEYPDSPHWGRYFTDPEDRAGNPIDWDQVPVNMGRFPNFERSIGWMPTVRDLTAPIQSLWIARRAARLRHGEPA